MQYNFSFLTSGTASAVTHFAKLFLNSSDVSEALTVAVSSVSSETIWTFTGELEAFTWSAHSVDVTAVSAGEAWILLWKTGCKNIETYTG